MRHTTKSPLLVSRLGLQFAITLATLWMLPLSLIAQQARSPGGVTADQIAVKPGDLPQLEESIRRTYQIVAPATVAIYNRNGFHVGSGTVISPQGLVLTHGTGAIGKRRIGMSFDVKLGSGRTTTGKYVGVNRAYRMSIMQLAGTGPWPYVDIQSASRLTPGTPALAIGYPTGYYQTGRPPLLRLTRVNGLSPKKVSVPIEVRNGDIGGPLFTLDGKLVGICHEFRHDYLRADLYDEIKDDLLAGKFIRKTTLPDPFDTSQLSELAGVHNSVVRILHDGQQLALGLIVAADGYLITKASELQGNVMCELSDRRRLAATRVATSWSYDIALLKIEADQLPVARWSEQPPRMATVLASIGPQPQPLSVGAVGSEVISVPRDGGQIGFQVTKAAADGSGVVVGEILFALTNEVLDTGDVLAKFNNKSIKTVAEFHQELARLRAETAQTIVGNTIPAVVRRGGQVIHVGIPIESSNEAQRSRPVGDKFAPLAHVDLRGRHTGFPAVFVHDALIRRPRPADVFTPYVSRKDLGSPVVDTSGQIVGLNIGSHDAYFVYALPSKVLRREVQKLLSAGGLEAAKHEQPR